MIMHCYQCQLLWLVFADAGLTKHQLSWNDNVPFRDFIRMLDDLEHRLNCFRAEFLRMLADAAE